MGEHSPKEGLSLKLLKTGFKTLKYQMLWSVHKSPSSIKLGWCEPGDQRQCNQMLLLTVLNADEKPVNKVLVSEDQLFSDCI